MSQQSLGAEIPPMNTSIPSHPTQQTVDWSQRSLVELIDHIVQQHHAYLRRELPSLNQLARRFDPSASPNSSNIAELRGVLAALTQELLQHMHKEELVLFPWIAQLESLRNARAIHGGTIAAPIDVMRHEHDFAEQALSRLR